MPRIDPADFDAAWDLPPEDAIRFLQSKGYQITWDWREASALAHEQAFTVSKVLDAELLRDIKSALIRAQQNGTPFQAFKKQLEPILQSRGWLARPEGKNRLLPVTRSITNPATGLAADVTLAAPWRLQTIFQTNIQAALQAGRLRQQMALRKIRPYLMYIAVGDIVTRPAHLRLNGFVAPADDPIWKKIYPPNGYGCRCRVRSLTEAEVLRMGLEVLTGKDAKWFSPDKGFDSAPTLDPWHPDFSVYPPDIADQLRRALHGR